MKAVGGGVQVSVRHIEAIIRMSEAHARMHLREYALNEDLDVAIRYVSLSLPTHVLIVRSVCYWRASSISRNSL